jgi:hypothetical protein
MPYRIPAPHHRAGGGGVLQAASMTARTLAAVAALPPAATDDTVQAIAFALQEGCDRRQALFRDCARAARRHFEAGNWRTLLHARGIASPRTARRAPL